MRHKYFESLSYIISKKYNWKPKNHIHFDMYCNHQLNFWIGDNYCKNKIISNDILGSYAYTDSVIAFKKLINNEYKNIIRDHVHDCLHINDYLRAHNKYPLNILMKEAMNQQSYNILEYCVNNNLIDDEFINNIIKDKSYIVQLSLLKNLGYQFTNIEKKIIIDLNDNFSQYVNRIIQKKFY